MYFFYSVDFYSHPKDVIYSLNQLVFFSNNLPCLNQKLYSFFFSLLIGKQHYPEWNCDGQPITTAKFFLRGAV